VWSKVIHRLCIRGLSVGEKVIHRLAGVIHSICYLLPVVERVVIHRLSVGITTRGIVLPLGR